MFKEIVDSQKQQKLAISPEREKQEPPPKFTSSTELITYQKNAIADQEKDLDELVGVV